jgi:steroid delta-isomerase-like uncharacterized protein
MSIEDTKAVYRRWIDEVFSQGLVAVADELHAADYVDHSGLPGVPSTTAGLKRFVIGLHSTFPDIVFTIEQVIAEGDRVEGYWTMRGTQRGAFQQLPPTGRAVTMAGFDLVRIANGQIAEVWHLADTAGLVRQLTAPQ